MNLLLHFKTFSSGLLDKVVFCNLGSSPRERNHFPQLYETISKLIINFNYFELYSSLHFLRDTSFAVKVYLNLNLNKQWGC